VILVQALTIWLFFSWDKVQTQVRFSDKKPFLIHVDGLVMVLIEAIVRIQFGDAK
jgi:hypothetical protein